MKKIEATKILDFSESEWDFFITSASFEKRCLTIANELKKGRKPFKTAVFYSENNHLLEINKTELSRILGGDYTTNELSISNPILTTNSIVKGVSDLIEHKSGKLLIDITTFTHEQLLILVRFLLHMKQNDRTSVTISFAYTGADKYSFNTQEQDMWLSRGVKDIRPVIGYPGRFKSNQLTQLVILVGFEHDRARAAIEHIEPALLTLCKGSKFGSISPNLSEKNSFFEGRLKDFVESISFSFSDVASAEISLIDPEVCCDKILESISPESHNVVLCPMNTKISTLGAALAAFRDPRIQICYVEPLEYNQDGYSIPDTFIRIGELGPFKD